MNIAGNINSRKLANFIIELAEDHFGEAKGEKVEKRFWEVVAQEAARRCGAEVLYPEPVRTMDDDEAIEFEEWLVPYGVNRGLKVRDVPIPYWLATEHSEFSRLLRLWMASPRFAALRLKLGK